MRKGNPLPALLRAFFQEWLAEQRSASIHTIRSYRDTFCGSVVASTKVT